MASALTFRVPDEKDAAIIFHMLSRAWAPIKNLPDNPVPEGWEDDLKALEKQLLQQPVVRSNFRISEHNSIPVGVFQFNLVYGDNTAMVGYHCIMSEYRGKEFGKQQMLEMIRLVFANHIDALDAISYTHPYFAPALATYKEAGFQEVERTKLPGSKYEKLRLRVTRPR